MLLFAASAPFYKDVSEGYQYQNVGHKKQMLDSVKKDSLDVLLMGDSQVWAGLSPLQLYGEYGIASYNCATSGQCTYDTMILLKEALKRQNPKIVVIGTSSFYSGPQPLKFLLTHILPVFHYHGFSNRNTKAYGDEKYLGAHLVNTVDPYTGSGKYMEKNKKCDEMSPIQKTYLDDMKDICKARGIKLVFVTMPTGVNWTDGKHDAVQKYADEYDIPYYDYNEAKAFTRLGFNWSTDTRDAGKHVNISGSIKITRDFGRILKAHYTLQDHRGESEYQSWENEYKNCGFYS